MSTLDSLSTEQVAAIVAQALKVTENDIYASIDTVWLILTIACIFMMQLGFLLLESGSLTVSHSQTIILKNVSDAAFGAVGWYFVGHWVYSGISPMVNDTEEFLSWFQSYVFAVTTATILSGGVACRIKFSAYVIYSTILSCWVYPNIARWCWGSDQYLSDDGFLDFAGSGPVHLLGGTSALIGTIALRPRKYRFTADGRDNQPQGSSNANFVMGAFILWFGWFSFNAGSSVSVRGESRLLASRAALNTLLASAVAGMTAVCVALKFFRSKVLTVVVNGVLGGLVGITAGCAYVDTYSAMLIGFISVFIVIGASELLIKLRIDDPLDASAVHGFCGFFGVIAVGFLHSTKGLFCGGTSALLVTQFTGVMMIIGWASIHAIVFFFGGRKFIRVSVEKELAGLDNAYMDSDANLDAHRIREHNEVKMAKKALAIRKKRKNLVAASSGNSFLDEHV